ncbi:MAG: hypothetical protein AAF802_08830 [Planctomycetota bacterium]
MQIRNLFLLVWIALGALVLSLASNHQLSAADVSTTELGRHVRDQLIAHSKAADAKSRDQAVAALCDLYVVLRSDSRFASSEMLQGDAAKLRRRLITVARQRERQLERDGIERPGNLTGIVDAAVRRSLGGGDESGYGGSQSTGGGFQAGGGALVDGNGWELIELIKRIIDPNFWSDRGGNGTIQYFALSRALVIRATSDHHQQIKDLLDALR